VEIKKFKIEKYKSSNNAKHISFKADVFKVYKGDDFLRKSIEFKLSIKKDNSYSPISSGKVLVFLNRDKNRLFVNPSLILPTKKVFLDFLEDKKYFLNYWDLATYDKWNGVPKRESIYKGKLTKFVSKDINNTKIVENFISLFKDMHFVGLLEVKKYKKINCGSESGDCGVYRAKVLSVYKGDKSKKEIIFIDDFTDNPRVYSDKAIYFLFKYEGDKIYNQDEFVQIPGTKEWIEFFEKLSKK